MTHRRKQAESERQGKIVEILSEGPLWGEHLKRVFYPWVNNAHRKNFAYKIDDAALTMVYFDPEIKQLCHNKRIDRFKRGELKFFYLPETVPPEIKVKNPAERAMFCDYLELELGAPEETILRWRATVSEEFLDILHRRYKQSGA